MIRDLVIVGAGGHGREVASIVLDLNRTSPTFRLLGFAADRPPGPDVVDRLGVPYLGPADGLDWTTCSFVVGIGDPVARRRVAGECRAAGAVPATIVHPSASIGADSLLGEGVVVFPGAVITTNVRLGDHVHVNVNASISHDCTLGSFVTVSPGSVVCGSVDLAEEVYVGANACIIQNVSIGRATFVAAGATVVSSWGADLLVGGTPARLLK